MNMPRLPSQDLETLRALTGLSEKDGAWRFRQCRCAAEVPEDCQCDITDGEFYATRARMLEGKLARVRQQITERQER